MTDKHQRENWNQHKKDLVGEELLALAITIGLPEMSKIWVKMTDMAEMTGMADMTVMTTMNAITNELTHVYY